MSGTKRIIAALLVLIMGSVAGCGASSAESSVDIAELTGAYQTEGQSVSKVDYVAPVQIPNILVDQTGFEQESEKVAIFRGKDLPRTFQIRNLKTGEVAFIGDVVKAVLDKESGKYYGIGRFNSFKEPGTYVIYAEHLGESFSFSIGEDIYKDVLDRACQKYYTNRCGIAISQIVSGDNGHSACHTTKARLQENTDTLIDVTGGWHMDEHADRDALIGAKVVEELLLAYENHILQARESGAKGYISKVASEEELLLALETLYRGGEYIEKRMEEVQKKLSGVDSLFSRQEKIIFEKLLQGKSNRQIAEELFISSHSVENYVSFIYDKTSVKNRRELIEKFEDKAEN